MGRVEIVSLKMVRDRAVSAPERIRHPEDVVAFWGTLHPDAPDREELWLICLDSRMKPTRASMVSRGDLHGAIATPREVFKTAILTNASYVILIHNHPSGDPKPSEDDRAMTEILWHAGEILGIPVRDHIVVGDGKFSSLAVEEGWESLNYLNQSVSAPVELAIGET